MILKNGAILGPYWGKSIAPRTGRDQLGMQASSVATYALLLPGLTNQTQRIRYYSYYCWLLNKFAYTFRDKATVTFRKFIRRAEILFAFSTLLSDANQRGVPGSLFVRSYVNKYGWPQEDRDLDIASFADKESGRRTYWQHAGGAFEQYYLGPLIRIRLIEQVQGDQRRLGLTNIGSKLAQAFENTLTDRNCRIVLDAIEDGRISLRDLKGISAEFNCYSLVIETDETKILTDLLFRSQAAGRDEFRRQSIILLLECVLAADKIEHVEEFLNSVYYGTTSDKRDIDFGVSKHSIEMWVFYRISEYCHYSFETIFRWLLTYLISEGSWNSVPVCAASFKELVLRDINQLLPDLNNIESDTPISDIVTRLKKYNDGKWSDVGSPDWLLSSDRKDCGVAACVLAILALASRHYEDLKDFLSLSRQYDFLREGNIIEVLSQCLSPMDKTFNAFVEHVLMQDIVSRHLSVAYRKIHERRLNTLKLSYENNALMGIQDFKVPWTRPRVSSLMQFLKDLKVLTDGGQLTEYGKSVYGQAVKS